MGRTGVYYNIRKIRGNRYENKRCAASGIQSSVSARDWLLFQGSI